MTDVQKKQESSWRECYRFVQRENLNLQRKYKRIQKTLDKSIFLQRTM